MVKTKQVKWEKDNVKKWKRNRKLHDFFFPITMLPHVGILTINPKTTNATNISMA